MKRFVKQFHDEGGVIISVSDGIPFPGFGIHEELRLLVDAGISPADALKSATISAAKVLNWDGIIGNVYPGKRADLVLLDGDPLKDISNRKKIAGVFINGVRLTKHELQSLKKKAVQLLQ
jgi:imidazolonepropionase-like amidohydrolase